MSALPTSPAGVVVIYDGECPFCSSYVKLVRLRQAVGSVELINARLRPDIVKELEGAGIDLDEGMVVRADGKLLHGADAVHWLSLRSSGDGIAGRLHRLALGNRRVARFAYPAMRAGRNLALRLLNRNPIGKLQ